MHSRRRNSSFSTVKQAERTSKHNSKSHVPSRSKQSESQNAVVPKTVKSEQRKAQIPEAGDHVQPEELPVLHMKHKQRTRWGESDGKRQPDENKPIRLSQEVTDRRLHSAEKETPTRRTHNTSNDQTEGKKIGGEQHSSVRKRGHHKDRSRTETFITAEQIKENTGEELANESKPKVELMDWHHLKKAKAETGLVVEFSSDLDRKVEKTSKVSQMSATPLITVHYESLSADQQGCTEDPEEYGSDFEVPNSGGSESDSLSGPTNIAKLSEFQTFGEPSLHYLWSFVTHQNVDQPSTPSGQVINEHSPDTKQLIDFSRSFGSTVRRSGQRLLRRAKNLLRLIELEFDGTGHVFELKPLDGYANYMVRFGKANHCQVHVQTNDDALDREAQTDEIELCKGGGVWTQWPPLDTDGDAYVKGVLKIDPYDEGPQSYMLSDLLNDFYPHNSPHHDVTDKHIRQSQALNIDTVPSSTSLLSRLRVVLHVLNEENLPDLNCLSVQNSVLTQDLFHNTECVNSPNGPDSQILKPGERVCISCQFAICNGDRLLTIHLPEKLLPTKNPTNHYGFPRQAGEVIYVWSVSGGTSVPDYQLYCPGLSETGLQGANITDAIFSPDVDANMVKLVVSLDKTRAINSSLLHVNVHEQCVCLARLVAEFLCECGDKPNVDVLLRMVVGGLADGSVCLWDLRCPQFDSSTKKQSKRYPSVNFASQDNWTPPIYTTSAIENHQLHTDFPLRHISTEVKRGPTKAQTFRCLGHSAPIVGLQLTRRYDKPLESSFQFVALDAFGELSLWMVLKHLPGKIRTIYETLSGSQVDLGLRPNERSAQMIRLMHITIPTHYTDFLHSVSKSLMQEPPTADVETDFASTMNMKHSRPYIMATTLAITTAGHFLIGFADGIIIQHSRSPGQVVYPRHFDRPASHAAVCSLVSHPERSLSIVLAGYADGMIRLYHMQQPQALFHWFTSDSRARLDPIVKLTWSYTVPSVFFSLDSTGSMVSWNIVGGSQDRHPLCTLPDSGDFKNDKVHQSRIRDFSLSNGILINVDGQTKSMTAFALVYTDTVKIHWLEPECTIHGSADDLALLRRFLHEWISLS